jgi:hypothetical protein
MVMLIAAHMDRPGAEIGQHYELFNERVMARVIPRRHRRAAFAPPRRDAIARHEAQRSPCRRRRSARS